MKRTIVNMILAAVLSAIAGQSWAQGGTATISQGSYSGGTVKIYGANYDPAGSNSTISSAAYQSKVYLVVEADYAHSNLNIDWRVQMAMSSSHAQSRGETPGYGGYVKVDHESGRIYSFTVPDDVYEVVVNAVFPEKKAEDVTYIDPTDASGPKELTAEAYILDGTETKLGSDGIESWYVCATPATANDDPGLTYGKTLTLLGNVNLILADGCKMTVGTASSPISGVAFDHNSGSFTVFGQTDGSGTLAAYGATAGLHCSNINLTFNGGIVDIRGNNTGIILSNTPITINAGQMTAAAINGLGILTSYQPITINGGKVAAYGNSAGIVCQNASIKLGWTHPDDYIYVSSYDCENSTISTASGKRFVSYATEMDFHNQGFDPALTTIEASAIYGSVTGTANVGNNSRETLKPLVYKEYDGQGGTAYGPGYLLSVTASGITPVGRTEPDFTIGTTPYYIYKSGGDGVTIPVSVKNYGQEGVDFEVSIAGADPIVLSGTAVTGSGETVTAALPWIGANDVELRLALSYCTGVKYMDWDDAQKILVNTDTSKDADPINKVYLLTGGDATTLPGGWYMVKNWNTDESVNSGIDAFYTGTVQFTGDTHLILGDGASMSVDSRNTTGSLDCIHVEPGSLSIYAQSTDVDMGQLCTFSKNNCPCIVSFSTYYDNRLTINGGNISCTVPSSSCLKSSSIDNDASVIINGGNISCGGNNGTGISVFSGYGDASVTVNGGIITVDGDNMFECFYVNSVARSSITINDGIFDIHVKYNFCFVFSDDDTSISSALSILGGKVKVSSEEGFYVHSSNNDSQILLGWKNPDDYIYTTNYDVNGTVRIVDDQYLMACGSPDGTGKAYNGTLNATDINAIKGLYLRPAMYRIDATQDVTLSVADIVGTVDPVTLGSGDAAKTFYLYDPYNTVTASLKNESFETDFKFVDPLDNDVFLDLPDGTNTNEKPNANSVTAKMPDFDFRFTTDGIRIPSDGKKYLAFVDDIEDITANYNDLVILVFLGLDKNPSTGAIEAVFEQADEILYDMTLDDGDKNMVPLGLPVIFARGTEGRNLPESIPVGEPTSTNALDAADKIRAAASPLFMTGTAGQTVAQVLRAALTDDWGNPLLDSNNLPLSLDAADYVIFLFDADKFVPVAASASSKLTGRRYLLAVDKVTLLQFLNGSAATARAAQRTGRVWTFPLVLGSDTNAITCLPADDDRTAPWYTIDGRRLQNRPAHKGVYINNGKKTVIK